MALYKFGPRGRTITLISSGHIGLPQRIGRTAIITLDYQAYKWLFQLLSDAPKRGQLTLLHLRNHGLSIGGGTLNQLRLALL